MRSRAINKKSNQTKRLPRPANYAAVAEELPIYSTEPWEQAIAEHGLVYISQKNVRSEHRSQQFRNSPPAGAIGPFKRQGVEF